MVLEEDGEEDMSVWIEDLVVFEEDGEDKMTLCERGRKVLERFHGFKINFKKCHYIYILHFLREFF